MFKLITISGDTVRLDEEGVSAMLTHACDRPGQPLYIEGAAADGDALTLICTSRAAASAAPRYRLSQVGNYGAPASLTAELRTRYDAGFRTVAGFRLADTYWVLTEKRD